MIKQARTKNRVEASELSEIQFFEVALHEFDLFIIENVLHELGFFDIFFASGLRTIASPDCAGVVRGTFERNCIRQALLILGSSDALPSTAPWG